MLVFEAYTYVLNEPKTQTETSRKIFGCCLVYSSVEVHRYDKKQEKKSANQEYASSSNFVVPIYFCLPPSKHRISTFSIYYAVSSAVLVPKSGAGGRQDRIYARPKQENLQQQL